MIIAGRNIKRIVASGCSFAYGQGLDDPKTESWPAQLASLMGVECVNLGKPGMGNEHVFSSIVDYFAFNAQHTTDSFVIPSFSEFSRVEFTLPASPGYPSKNWTTILNSRCEPKFTSMFFEKFYVEEYYYARYMRTIISLQAIMKSWDVEYLMFEGLGLAHLLHKNMIDRDEVKKLVERIDRTRWLRFMAGNFDTMTDPRQRLPCRHPNAVAHNEMANRLYEYIINNYTTEQ